ncbi:MAG: type I-E CRISPR-associated protein Cas5/CasD [Lachnospiraceae bacterium]|jgi:CRISPR system Cascade subunit CasD|nr:type I-E CRISPR-associated protein Cas5/CasD [Lachnospiraceae bacterium]
MSTLLLRLAAPLQSWGVASKFDRRDTQRYPSKSGIIGLLAAALGRSREDSMEDLAALRFGVRIDQEGELLRDYHTAKSAKSAYVTNRYYLSDAIFLCGLEGEDSKLHELEDALLTPKYPLFLGRRSCPPEGKVLLGVMDGTLENALATYPSLAMKSVKTGANWIVMDASMSTPGAYFVRDLPISFSVRHRKFAFRSVIEKGQMQIGDAHVVDPYDIL